MTNIENLNPLPAFEGQLLNLFHPAQGFQHPADVVADRDLTLTEKRAILAAWASDACATEASPALRSNGSTVVPIDDIFEALSALDHEARKSPLDGWATRQLRRQKIDKLRNLGTLPVRKLPWSSTKGGNYAL